MAEFTRRTQKNLAGRATVLVFTVAGVIMTVCAVVVFNVDRSAPKSNIKTFPDALWWAVSTVTAVGYGDKFPHTADGRAVAVILMLTGIALVGTMTAAIAAWFVGSTQRPTAKPRRKTRTKPKPNVPYSWPRWPLCEEHSTSFDPNWHSFGPRL